jgi:Nucleotidyl transferase AbiEii toxin, Type IV TA system
VRGIRWLEQLFPVSDVLTEFQVEVTKVFFSLPASQGFLLAGGAALVAQQLTTRPTYDLDFFTRRGCATVSAARDALESTAVERGWSVRRVRDTETFVRLVVTGPEELLVDLALDSAPGRPSVVTCIGPSFDPEELAGRKLVALFDRAEARDFADVHTLTSRFGKSLLLQRAAEVDRGFDPQILADMMRALSRFTDDQIPVAQGKVAALRRFFTEWATELSSAVTE